MRISSRIPALAAAAVLWLSAAPALAQGASGNGLPPLIDRELFFGDPEISGAQISPDGSHIAFIRPYNGTRNIWVKRTEEPFEKARPVTADTRRPIPGFFWSRDGRFILFVQDEGGDENYNVHAVNPADRPAPGRDVPSARNLTEAKEVRAVIFSVPRSEPDVLYVGLNERDRAWHDLYEVRISTGERTRLRENTERITSWVFDRKDRLRLATRAAENGDTEVLRVDESGFTKIYDCNVFESCGPVRFHRDNARVYMVTNKGAGTDLVRLVLFDVASGREELVESDPKGRVDLGGTMFSDRTDELLATVYVDEKPRWHWKDEAFAADHEWLRGRLEGREVVSFSNSTADERLWLVNARSDREPGETYLFDRRAKALTLQYRIREKLPREHLAPMTAISYRSSDGLEIPAYLTLPEGMEPKGLPLVVVPHGGPWARDVWGYDSWAQFLANRGYAVLQPNFRGSAGFGQEFLDAGNLEWGDRMQDDITWGARHLVETGIADPERIGIFGASYGGYATLAGLAFTPDLYAAGVSLVGPSNLITLLDSIPPYWEPVRKLFHERMGDPSTPEGRAQLERQSPLNSAEKIAAPLLVIQGANDPRVKKAESDQIVVALRERGFPVEYIVAPDEGHGFARPVNNMAAFAATERFLARHLGGRYQESMTPEVTARLAEITVDPKTVEMPKTLEVTEGAPAPAADLQPGTRSYTARIEMGGQSMDMSTTTDVRQQDGEWIVTETATIPMGEVTDRTTLAGGTLVLRHRRIAQGPMVIEFAVRDGRAVGEMKMAGQAKPIEADLGGDLFADGAGAHLVVATLPLAEGYRTTYRNFDVQRQRVKLLELQVVGTESVTVDAGTFEAFRIEIRSPDDGANTTLWVAKATRVPVKAVSVAPQMGGATITSELQK